MKPINEEIKTEILSAPHIAEATAYLRDVRDGSLAEVPEYVVVKYTQAEAEDTDDFEALHAGYDEANRHIVRPDGVTKILDFVAELVVLRKEQLGGPAEDYDALYPITHKAIARGWDMKYARYTVEDSLWCTLRNLHDELSNRRKWSPIFEPSPPLAQIVTDVCVRAGIPEDKIDTSELTDVHRNKWDEQLARLRGKLVKRVRDEHPNLRAENERLRAENHKLRAENNRLTVSANEVAALQAELDRVRRVHRAEAQPVIAPRSGYRWGLLP